LVWFGLVWSLCTCGVGLPSATQEKSTEPPVQHIFMYKEKMHLII